MLDEYSVMSEIENAIIDYCKLFSLSYYYENTFFTLHNDNRDLFSVGILKLEERVYLTTCAAIFKAHTPNQEQFLREIEADEETQKYIESTGISLFYEESELNLTLSVGLSDEMNLVKTMTILQMSSFSRQANEIKTFLSNTFFAEGLVN